MVCTEGRCTLGRDGRGIGINSEGTAVLGSCVWMEWMNDFHVDERISSIWSATQIEHNSKGNVMYNERSLRTVATHACIPWCNELTKTPSANAKVRLGWDLCVWPLVRNDSRSRLHLVTTVIPPWLRFHIALPWHESANLTPTTRPKHTYIVRKVLWYTIGWCGWGIVYLK